jgi:hypothetical protein
MYHNDHAPPHFHARYQGHEAVIGIEQLDVLRGGLPKRALALGREWATLRRAELSENWSLARHGYPLTPIAPLE